MLELVGPELKRAFRGKRYSDVLAFIALLKRSVSTVEALRSTLRVIHDRFSAALSEGEEDQESKRQRLRTLRDYQRKLERFGTVSHEEAEEMSQLEAEDLGRQLAAMERETRSGARKLTRFSSVVDALKDLLRLSDETFEQDPKLKKMVEEIAGIRSREPGANILIYTEYTTSQDALVRALRTAQVGPVLTISGADDDAVRGEVTERFRSEDNLVLVSTDAAAEGLNLQQRCHQLIHLELPFNPNRLEQRNGRIDRYGQEFNPIVHYLFLKGTFEERILLRLVAKYERQRARLTFVPNTLGLTVAGDTATEKLLKGLMDEETHLFQTEGTLFNFTEGDEFEGADEATRELLEEIDRSLKGYEQAARSHSWLAEAGLNAEQQLLTDAQDACDAGQRASAVDLASFVCNAVLLDGGEMTGTVGDAVFSVTPPPSWRSALQEIGGCEDGSRRVPLTTRLEVTRDDSGKPVGFLGRGHPLVRKALDRVRNLALGADAKSGQDLRVSVVAAEVEEPALLYTFLGRVRSGAGRELEHVLAVQVSRKHKPRAYTTSEEWLALADPQRALRTTDVWKNRFAAWAQGTAEQARNAAHAAFERIAADCVEQLRQSLKKERAESTAWLNDRAEEITELARPRAVQVELAFDGEEADPTPPEPKTHWSNLADPAERLAAFAADRAQSPAKRTEAEGVLRLYRQQTEEFTLRSEVQPPEVTPLELLMLVPEGR